MAGKKIIAIVGATGNQGSSVAKTFALTGGWHVRCLTRDPTSAKAQTLAEIGCELVQADLSDPTSLSPAFDGAHAIFLNTELAGAYRAYLATGEDHDTAMQRAFDSEVNSGKNAIHAIKNVATLERLVYSALGSVKRVSGGKYHHTTFFETKAAIVDYIEADHPLLAAKTSYIYIGAYIDHPFLRPKLDVASGRYVGMLSCSKQTHFPVINAAESTGPFVRCLIEDEDPKTRLLAYDARLTVGEALDQWSGVTGKSYVFVQETLEDMSNKTGMPLTFIEFPAALEEFGYCTEGAVIEPHQLKRKPQTQSYEDFLRQQDVDVLLGDVANTN
ncbi:hypothetical protein JX265_009791 [Neoarthrinium moseri]|uniref:NmrA-like domain-containing protein n=1 Tax=Neoarthrinium moseri TaxID=1658444 RepID=A0A9Q0AL38_9PEZI|nr:uncharacterized protein JN550_013504 [Neoarthrinium moseri]KAI1857011.1 hypothetical protein JN550_013504 [Neoarthrinium moseri]KAI1861172.1 hypothetical protein JX265_009791 [Neoarthrinium moseri]